MKKEIKNCWVIVDPKGNICLTTIQYTKRECINQFADSEHPFSEWKKSGWNCVKVNVTLTLI